MKTITLGLDYSKKSLEEVLNGVVSSISAAELTRRMISFAVNSNNREGISRNEGRMWGRIQDAMEDTDDGRVELSLEQFDWLYAQIEKAKLPSVSAQAATRLWDHFDEVKVAKAEEKSGAEVEAPGARSGIAKTARQRRP